MQKDKPLKKYLSHRFRLGLKARIHARKAVQPTSSSKVFSYSQAIKNGEIVEEQEELILTKSPVKPQEPSKNHSNLQVQTESQSVPKRKKSVSFSSVQVREYALILGDNEAPEGGYPLSIDWKFNPQVETYNSVEDYDQLRDEMGRRESLDIEGLTQHERRLWLRNFYTEDQLRQAERRRKVQEVLEWAYGQNQTSVPFFPTARFVERYIR